MDYEIETEAREEVTPGLNDEEPSEEEVKAFYEEIECLQAEEHLKNCKNHEQRN